jgi:hypothetical protein
MDFNLMARASLLKLIAAELFKKLSAFMELCIANSPSGDYKYYCVG